MSLAFSLPPTSAAAASTAVVDGIRRACEATGVDFSYMLTQASLESGLDAKAKAATSTATGLFQFIEQTWLGLFREHAAKYGEAELAARVVEGADGRLTVADPAERRRILDLRRDPAMAASLSAEHTQDNAATLARRLGRAPSASELYIAHFLGNRGAVRLLANLASEPQRPAAELLPKAANANRSIFYAKDGSARTVSQVCDEIERRFERAAAGVQGLVAESGEAPDTNDTAFVPAAAYTGWAELPGALACNLSLPILSLMELQEFADDRKGRRVA